LALEWVAHTFPYDAAIIRSAAVARLSTITTPTLVLASVASDDRLRSWAQQLRDTLPNASLRMLKGEWHGIPPEALAPVLAEFFLGPLS
jgi:hypothetical protein